MESSTGADAAEYAIWTVFRGVLVGNPTGAVQSKVHTVSGHTAPVTEQRFFGDCVRALAALEAIFSAVLQIMRPQPLRLGSLRHLWARHARQRRPQGRLVRRDCGFNGFSRFYCRF